MSILHCGDVQIWNNAAFDSAVGGGCPATADEPPVRVSWLPLQPISTNRPDTLDLVSGKENCSPAASKKSPAAKPLRPKPFLNPSKNPSDADDGKIDAEIEEIEREIGRLSERLKALRIKKAERDSKTSRPGGRIVPAKFMETPDAKKVLGSLRIQKSSRNLEGMKKTEETPASVKHRRRGLSLGPMDIRSSSRELQVLDAPESTNLGSVQGRRKSCFLKLEGIQEEKGASMYTTPKHRRSISISKALEPMREIAMDQSKKKGAETRPVASDARIRRRGLSLGPSEIASSARIRQSGKIQELRGKGVKEGNGRSLSVSPKSRQPSRTNIADLRKGIATVGVRKSVQKEDVGSIKPKVLFQEAKNLPSSKKPLKNMKVRVVPSRYSLATSRVTGDEPGSKRRKWSMPEPDMEKATRVESKRSLSLGEYGGNQEQEDSVKKEMEITREGLDGRVSCTSSFDWSPPSIKKIAESLPKIRTSRCIAESPRDSGRAKRVAELVGRKSYFGTIESEAVAVPCEVLMYEA